MQNMIERKFLHEDSYKARRVVQNFRGNFKPDRQKADISPKIQIIYSTPDFFVLFYKTAIEIFFVLQVLIADRYLETQCK